MGLKLLAVDDFLACLVDNNLVALVVGRISEVLGCSGLGLRLCHGSSRGGLAAHLHGVVLSGSRRLGFGGGDLLALLPFALLSEKVVQVFSVAHFSSPSSLDYLKACSFL